MNQYQNNCNSYYNYQQPPLVSPQQQQQFYAPRHQSNTQTGSNYLYPIQQSTCNAFPQYASTVLNMPTSNIQQPPHLHVPALHPPFTNQLHPPPPQQQYNNISTYMQSWNDNSSKVNSSNYLQPCNSYQGVVNDMHQQNNFHNGFQKNQTRNYNNFQNQNKCYNQYQNWNHKVNVNEKSIGRDKDTVSNGLYRCVPCEKDFNGEKALSAHQKMHIKCDECSYSASSKSVKLHFIQNHAEGKFRICLETPEKIEQWKEERRRNWPSLSNIALKQKKEQTNHEAGIVIGRKEFIYQEQSNHNDRRKGRRGGIHVRGQGRQGKFNANSIDKKDKNLFKDNAAVLANGISNENIENSKSADSLPVSFEDSFDSNFPQSSDCKVNTVNKNGLSLLHEYDDSCDEQSNLSLKTKEEGELDTEPEEIISESLNVPPVVTEPDANNNSDSKSQLKRNKRRKRKGKQNDNQNLSSDDTEGAKYKKVSLLEMLLSNEIRHERNVILQCIRYIVNKNFFGC